MVSNIFKIILVTLTSLVMASAVFAGGLNVVLSSQNPDPVAPGNFVYLNVKLSNGDTQNLDAVTIKFLENQYLALAPGEDLIKNIGTLSGYSTGTDSNSFTIAKFKIAVKDGTPLGLNTAQVEVSSSKGTYKYSFDVLVKDTNSGIDVTNFSSEQIIPGTSGKVSFVLDNSNSISVQNVHVSLGLDAVENKIFTVESGTSEQVFSNIAGNEKKLVTFNVVVSPSAVSKPYLLPLTITYEDSLGTSYTKSVFGSVNVYSKPLVVVQLDKQDIKTQGSGKITLSIANPGTSSVKGTQITILPSEDYQILDGGYSYLGDLNPDDFQTVQSNIYIKNAQAATLKVKLSYADSYNVAKEEIVELPLVLYTAEEQKNVRCNY